MVSIELKQVNVVRDNKEVLKDVSFQVEDGEYIGLLGPTGSGPSYILKVIAGLIPVKSGKIIIDNQDVTDMPPEDRRVGFVFEQFNLFPHLSVMDNLLYGPRMRRENIEDKKLVAKEILSLMRLTGREDAISKELSGGMKQRVGVARAVTAGAKILLLDQPYRALDAKIREELRFEIREISKELNLTVIHSTHETEEAMITSDRIAVFNDGVLEDYNTPKQIFNNPKTLFVARFLAENNQYTGQVEENKLNIDNIHFEVDTAKSPGKYQVLIRKQNVKLSTEKIEGSNVFEGTISRVRLLGEFIRFTVLIDNIFEIEIKEMLSLNRKNFDKMVETEVYIKIEPKYLKLFPLPS